MIDFHAAAQANRRRSRLLIAALTVLTVTVGLTLDALLQTSRGGGMPIVTLLLLAGMAGALWLAHAFGDRIVLASLGASAPDPTLHEHQQLQNVLREMAVASGLPEPRVLVIDDPAPNALATGIDPAHATIAVTTGLLEKLDRAQTQAVVAHELSHIGNRDTALGVTIAIAVGAIALLADVAWRIRRSPTQSRSSDGEGSRDPLAALLPLLVLVTALAPLASRLVAFAISRQREYLADATAVSFTRNPEALASALEAIAADRRPTTRGTQGTAHLFFVRPAASRADEREGFVADLFATHPPIAERIARLRGMS
ncbi:M48 family metallopeptidase [Candidatus Binatia bacterium]|nr:M48 family metallopeptidase [Candidatus Binatia bacterium]